MELRLPVFQVYSSLSVHPEGPNITPSEPCTAVWLLTGVRSIAHIGFTAQWNHPNGHACTVLLIQSVRSWEDMFFSHIVLQHKVYEWASSTYRVNEKIIEIMNNNIIQFIIKKTGTSWKHEVRGNKHNLFEKHNWCFQVLRGPVGVKTDQSC